MLKRRWLLCILLLPAVLVFGSCGKGQSDETRRLEGFLNRYYTIDTQTVGGFRSQADIERIDEKFTDDLTDREYTSFVKDRYYLEYVQKCKTSSSTISPKSIHITKSSGNTYNYTVTFTIASANGHTEDTEKGQISMIKDNGTWKISWFHTTKMSGYLTSVN